MSAFASSFERLSLFDRRQWLKAIVPILLATRSLPELVKVLTSPQVLAEKRKAQDSYVVIREFLSAYPEFCGTDHAAAKRVLKGFLTFLFSGHQDQGLRIEDVAVWLQPLANSQLLPDAVELTASSKWSPPNADPREWRFFGLVCRRIRASLYRRKGRMTEADRELGILQNEWLTQRSLSTERKFKELAIIEYELGYIAFSLGKTSDAKKYFQNSAHHASQAGDPIGELIGRFNAHFSDYHGRKTTGEKARKIFVPLRAELERVGLGQPRATAWLFTIDARLFQIALDEGNAQEAKKRCEMALQSESYKRSENDPSYQILKHDYLGRLAVVMSHYKTALRHFGRFLPVALPKFAKQDAELSKLCNDVAEIAVTYRDAGIALQALQLSGFAEKVWLAGLVCPDNKGNRFFKQDIRRLLKEHRQKNR